MVIHLTKNAFLQIARVDSIMQQSYYRWLNICNFSTSRRSATEGRPIHRLPRKAATGCQVPFLVHPHSQCDSNVLCPAPHSLPLPILPSALSYITVFPKPQWHVTLSKYLHSRVTMLIMSQFSLMFRFRGMSAFFPFWYTVILALKKKRVLK